MQDTGSQSPLNHNERLIIAAVIVVTLLLFQILVDPISRVRYFIVVNSLRRDLPIEQARWNAQGIKDYSIRVQGGCAAVSTDVVLTVRNGALASVVANVPTFNDEAPFTMTTVSIDKNDWDNPYCPYTELLVPRMFDKVERDLSRPDASDSAVSVAFDPQYGFITSYTNQYHIGFGIDSWAVSDCCIGYTFSDFQPLAATPSDVGPTP